MSACIYFVDNNPKYQEFLAEVQIGQSIEEWTKWSLWKTAFKKILKAVFHNVAKATVSSDIHVKFN